MKLLLDENLSRRVVPFIQHAYPGSTQVALLGMENAANKYDLSINRYKETVHQEEQYEPPKVILKSLIALEDEIQQELEGML